MNAVVRPRRWFLLPLLLAGVAVAAEAGPCGSSSCTCGTPAGSGEPFLVERPNLVYAKQSGPWSDPATWSSGAVPVAGASVNIPGPVAVTLDTSTARLDNLLVEGCVEVDAAAASTALDARWILVRGGGALRAGTPEQPHVGRFTITLWGTNETESIIGSGIMALGTKVLAIGQDGTLSLHGAARAKTSWVQLNAHAAVGATSITVDRATGWTVGDQIVIAASGWDPQEAERVTIAAVNGNQINFTPALKHRHFGQIISVPRAPGQSPVLVDERAEVGLLTRNIVVRGGSDSAKAPFVGESSGVPFRYLRGFGGHGMFLDGSTVRIEGVSLVHMGQTGRRGRYPIHWHFANDATGDFVRDCSISDSFQRAYVVHHSNHVLVQRNVAYDITNHGIMTEDGTETGNRFLDNLVVLTYSPREEDFAFGDPTIPHGGSAQSELRCANFWMVNGQNEVRGNHAAGAFEGIGFFFDTQTVFAGKGTPITQFVDNTVHSAYRPAVGGRDRYGPMEKGFGVMFRWVEMSFDDAVVEGMTAYKCSNGGMWIESGHQVKNSVFADNAFGVHVGSALVKDCILIGDTANDIGGSWPFRNGGVNFKGALMLATPRGYGPIIEGSTFIDTYPAGITGDRHTMSNDARASGCTFIRTRRVSFEHGGIGMRDLDGSVTGHAGGWILSDDGASAHAGSQTDANHAQFSPGIGQFFLQLDTDVAMPGGAPLTPSKSAPLVLTRSDGQTGNLFRPTQSNDDTRRGWVLPGLGYSVALDTPATSNLSVRIEHAATTMTGRLDFPLATAATVRGFATRDGALNLGRPLPKLASVAALATGTGAAYAVSGDRIHLRLAGSTTEQRFVPGSSAAALPGYAWMQQRLGGLGYPGAASAALYADPDGDGADNLQELATGSDPQVAGPAAVRFDLSGLPGQAVVHYRLAAGLGTDDALIDLSTDGGATWADPFQRSDSGTDQRQAVLSTKRGFDAFPGYFILRLRIGLDLAGGEPTAGEPTDIATWTVTVGGAPNLRTVRLRVVPDPGVMPELVPAAATAVADAGWWRLPGLAMTQDQVVRFFAILNGDG